MSADLHGGGKAQEIPLEGEKLANEFGSPLSPPVSQEAIPCVNHGQTQRDLPYDSDILDSFSFCSSLQGPALLGGRIGNENVKLRAPNERGVKFQTISRYSALNA